MSPGGNRGLNGACVDDNKEGCMGIEGSDTAIFRVYGRRQIVRRARWRNKEAEGEERQ